MPVFRLGREPIFPPIELAEPEGLLAIGGDLSADRLLAAYRRGIFPWYEPGGPILWWSPDPRLVLFPQELRISSRLSRTIRQGRFETRYDTAFAQVIRACAEVPRAHEEGTWITPEMQRAYIRLHELGHAHSMESWRGGLLVGGIYGVRVGRCFCGESMFHLEPDASKVALTALVQRLEAEGIELIDCQVASEHLLRLGAREIPRARFLAYLKPTLSAEPTKPTR
jgi:leucyl/phenylalanyl-tRNA--protein transferase